MVYVNHVGGRIGMCVVMTQYVHSFFNLIFNYLIINKFKSRFNKKTVEE